MIIAVIPAKGGSKRLPNKNVQKVNGKSLLDYSFEYVKMSKKLDDYYVTTDDNLIEEICINNKIKVIRRPVSLGGETPLIEVYNHFLTKISFSNQIQTLLGIQVDHPDRRVSIDEALNIFYKEKSDRLFSTQKDGIKNGAHYILSKYFLDSKKSRKDSYIIDDCTNVHYKKDLLKAEIFLKKNENYS